MLKEDGIPAITRDILQEISAGTSAETGEGFFDSLVQHLARALETKSAWVTEWFPDQRELSALSFWNRDGFVKDFRYLVTGSPCETVVDERREVRIPDRVIELYPLDGSLKSLGAVSYMGVPLVDIDGKVIGHLAVLDDKPMLEDQAASSILNIFAGRAAAELRRMKRDRAITESENKLSRLFEGAMDSIIEFDVDLKVTNLNSAAARTFGRRIGSSLHEFLTAESRNSLRRLLDELEHGFEAERSLWIPGEIDAIAVDGKVFPAEATLSRYETGGKAFYALVLRNVLERQEAQERVRSLMDETQYLRRELDELSGFDKLVGNSPALRRVLSDVNKVANTDSTVLITGETGTGKELIARAIHDRSGRSTRPLITVNCAAISANLQESEFFGHEKGSFTGASQRREGRFKLADGGTIFLDEVGEMSLDLQAKLLRVLQAGEFEPVGSSRTIRVDVRVIAATNRDLEEMTANGTFRSDLLYRLNVFPLHIPPLRERGDDVVLLAQAFAAKLARKRNRKIAPLSVIMKRRLMDYDWPGNVRELQNVIERAFITSVDGTTLNIERALPRRGRKAIVPQQDAQLIEQKILSLNDLKDFERENIQRALSAANGRISGVGGAADLLGLHANTLTSRMKSLGIHKRRI
jgi:PAS domain S-box-containing protein